MANPRLLLMNAMRGYRQSQQAISRLEDEISVEYLDIVEVIDNYFAGNDEPPTDVEEMDSILSELYEKKYD